jgi:glycerol-1-phosphate dehydrogenase [NAD(P)+]
MASPDLHKAIPVHRIDLPRIVLVGEGVLSSLNGVCRELGFHRALIVTGKNTLKVAGEKVQWILDSDGIYSDHSIVEDAQLETVGKVMDDAQRSRVEVLIGVGGGRNIDVAKLAAAKTGCAFISVPTVASHDGIASSLASVKGMDRPYTVKAISPIAVVMDSGIIAASPYRFTASGCGDVISKATEVEDWKLAHRDNGDYYGAYSGSLALMSSQLIMESAEKIRQNTAETIRDLLEALISCSTSMSIAGSSRPCSGSAHLFSHALDLIIDKPALHGEQCGVGTIMMAKLHGLDWIKIKDSLMTLGAPTTAEGLGIKREKIIEALTMAQKVRPERYTILSKIKLDRLSAEALATETGVI